jgi:hypothetical protein
MSRPKKKAEFIEGPQAFKNFENAAKAVFRAPKAEVKHKAMRKRKKS